MNGRPEAVLVTGASGALAASLLPMLRAGGRKIVAIDADLPPRQTTERLPGADVFESLDLGEEATTRRLFDLIREHAITDVVHLSAASLRYTRESRAERLWQQNVAGTGRLMESITEANRRDAHVRRVIFAGSALVYGPATGGAVTESTPLAAYGFVPAVHAMESDEVMRYWAEALTGCTCYVLRMQLASGGDASNLLLDALCPHPGKPLPLPVPFGAETLRSLFQFLHVEDAARIILHLLGRSDSEQALVLNVASRGEPLTLEQCAALAGAPLIRRPGFLRRRMLEQRWRDGISPVPPQAEPYVYGSCLVDTIALQHLLGDDYGSVIRHSHREAFLAGLPGQPSSNETA